jgi:hypothetical protein
MAVSFTSAAPAREGEPKEPPPLELQVQLEELAALRVGEPEFLDLTQPWRYGPRCAGLARPGELMSWLGLSGGAGERLTLPLTVAGDLGKRRSAQRSATTYSHRGSHLGRPRDPVESESAVRNRSFLRQAGC